MFTRAAFPPRLAFLIGGSEGIGLATARELARTGCTVVLFGRSEAKLRAALASLPATGGSRNAAHTGAGDPEDLTPGGGPEVPRAEARDREDLTPGGRPDAPRAEAANPEDVTTGVGPSTVASHAGRQPRDVGHSSPAPAPAHAAHVLDVRDRTLTEEVLARAVAEQGTPDLVLVTAGYARAAWLGEDAQGLAEDMIAVDLLGSINAARAVVPALRAAGGGRLVLTSSLAGLVAVPGYTAYSAAKFGVIGFADALRREVRRDGIRVSVLCPPNTTTPGFAAENVDKPAEVLASEEKVRTLPPEDVAAALLRALPRSPRLIVPGADSRLAALAVRLFPWIGDVALRRK
ncbi:MAG: SDR family NAD(P)-dependent oxidoreductase [Arthrobacter sp.]|jgi:3-dehydrosphinganine reductase|nr:SDR family NAD(P)-dependent oxidoreductase [Arthrobacter sp.]